MFKILSTCKGGGYRYARTDPPHPNANSKGLYPLHRVLMENKLGRLLQSQEHVHHIDEDKTNDDIDNLEVKSANIHARDHMLIDSIEHECSICQMSFSLKPHISRLRIKRSKTGAIACSRKCGGIQSRKI